MVWSWSDGADGAGESDVPASCWRAVVPAVTCLGCMPQSNRAHTLLKSALAGNARA